MGVMTIGKGLQPTTLQRLPDKMPMVLSIFWLHNLLNINPMFTLTEVVVIFALPFAVLCFLLVRDVYIDIRREMQRDSKR